MTTENFPCGFPGANWMDEAEQQAVLDVTRQRAVFRYYGPNEPKYAAALEETAKGYYGRQFALAVNSGTGALSAAMIAMGIGPGDEVIVPAFFWVASVGTVVHCNAIPVLCEVDESFNIDPVDLERKITPRTQLIVAVHMCGAPCDMERIMAVADKHGIDVMEDCAQCNGGSFGGKKVGSFGRVGMFSFQLNKNITSGEGGLLITDDEHLYWQMNAAHDLGVPWRGAAPDDQPADFLWGTGRRMSELCAAVANVQLSKLDTIVEHMRGSKQRIKAGLADLPDVTFRKLNDPAGDSGPFLVMTLKDAASAMSAVERMKAAGLTDLWRIADYGLHCYFNVPQLVNKTPLSPAGNPWSLAENAQSVCDYNKGACPNTDALLARSVVLAIPSRLTGEQEQFMIDAVRKALA
ncbi:MAG: DegT/DnrJ/EryC1/StrS family aminotransferase [Planctomycetota bacterium]|jgi:8-amino-3,8-dideoxy-alpha-D-manno-octulosonate transaminase